MSKRVELIWANKSGMDAGLQIQEHSHVCYQMYYILNGSPTYIIQGEPLSAHPDSFFYIAENTPHRREVCDEQTLSIELKFHIHDPYIVRHLPARPVLLEGNSSIIKMFSYIIENWKNKDPRNQLDIENLMTSLVSLFYLDQVRFDNRSSCRIDTSRYNELTRTAMAYIEDNFQSHFSLASLGQALSYNANYVSSVFTKNTGVPVTSYLNLVRIRQAVIFFAYYNQDVFTTYESIGFTDPSYFSRTFKSFVGISPRTFKRAFSGPEREFLLKRYTEEPILNYEECTLEEAFASLRNIGNAVRKVLQTAP